MFNLCKLLRAVLIIKISWSKTNRDFIFVVEYFSNMRKLSYCLFSVLEIQLFFTNKFWIKSDLTYSFQFSLKLFWFLFVFLLTKNIFSKSQSHWSNKTGYQWSKFIYRDITVS